MVLSKGLRGPFLSVGNISVRFDIICRQTVSIPVEAYFLHLLQVFALLQGILHAVPERNTKRDLPISRYLDKSSVLIITILAEWFNQKR